MVFWFLPLLVIPLVTSFSILDSILDGPNPSGGGCAACTIALGVFKRIADYQKIPLEDLLEYACKLVPEQYRNTCDELVKVFGPLIIILFAQELSPDEVCRKIEFCKAYPTCTLYHNHSGALSPFFLVDEEASDSSRRVIGMPPPVPPSENDKDGDEFSTYFYDYGSAWRGKDCDDSNAKIYPGRGTNPFNESSQKGLDYNCNGISGVNSKTGKTWEDELCSGVIRKGVVAIGDSACAHFRIPQQFMLPNVTMKELGFALPLTQNQFDWPHMSLYGGYETDTSGLTPGEVNSIYLQQRERNRCNHRDFQTCCVNGCDSNSVLRYGQTMTRDVKDHPVVLFVNLFGDDVCHSEHTFERMTEPAKFRKNIDSLLTWLDEVLPPGSDVVFSGLAHGTLLYKFLSQTTHPLGVKYEDVYDYLNCLGCNPCWGWLNSNETIRNLTQQRANELNAVFPQIIKEETHTFGMYYVDSGKVIHEILEETLAKHLSPTILAEPIDGFHPSQYTLPRFAEKMYAQLLKANPSIFGEVNPNNQLIETMFGNQGGY